MEKTSYQSHLRNQHNHWWFNARQEIIETFLEPFEKDVQGGPILDIGSGGGRILQYLSQFGQISALDKEPMVIQHIEKEFGPGVGKIGSLPDAVDFSSGAFRFVTTFDVLEHVEDDVGSLSRIRDLLMPQGLYLTTVPAYARFWSYHDDLSHHLRRYHPKELTKKLEEADFRIERMSFFSTFLLIPILITRFLRNHLATDPRVMKNDMDLAGGRVGRLLEWIFRSETFWIRRGRLPIGLSLIALCRKT